MRWYFYGSARKCTEAKMTEQPISLEDLPKFIERIDRTGELVRKFQ
jgi:hypothetical protein